MRISTIALAACGAAALAGCAGGPGPMGGRYAPGEELIGRSLRVETAQGQRSSLRFGRGGLVRAGFSGREVEGRWWAEDRRLCFRWPGATTECWPYAAPFRRGRTVPITSDRGNFVRVTLQ